MGGGAVYFSIDNANKFYINDKSKDLIELYNNIKEKKQPIHKLFSRN
ncbi:MAG: DNA adenine methylase [Candidatus Marinimicrobia bacterium]|nr:DNA adenine methylase [Candidatus Neomarinimicrobiota bacterium]